MNLKLGTNGINAPNSCTVVLVSGSALLDLQAIMDVLHLKVRGMLRIPLAVVVLDDGVGRINIKTTRHDMSPPIVSRKRNLSGY